MKLREGFITHEVDGTQILVAAGKTQFIGMVRSNRTAALIVESLKQDTSEKKICDMLEDKFDAPRSMIEKDVGRVIAQLRDIGAIDDED